MTVQFTPVVGKRKRKRDGKIIDVPFLSPCGAQQLSVKLDGTEVGLVLDKPGAPLCFTLSDLTPEEKLACIDAIEARTGSKPGSTSTPPSQSSIDDIGEEPVLIDDSDPIDDSGPIDM